jgi:DnaJ-class molecular chaperone
MGFDVYGKAARSEKGEYFRNNVWWWRPLAEYVLGSVEMSQEEQEEWHSNSGQKVSAKTASRIADRLCALIASGETAQYQERYEAELAALPLETCELCRGTGRRNDEFAKGECNGCDGKGQRQAWATHYPFSVENVKDFADFCRDSGGFEIW